jgi:hypothetical protein
MSEYFTNSKCKIEFEKIDDGERIEIESERVNTPNFKVNYKVFEENNILKENEGIINIETNGTTYIDDNYRWDGPTLTFKYKILQRGVLQEIKERLFINCELNDSPIYGHGFGNKYGLFYYKLLRQTIIHGGILPTFRYIITKKYPELPKLEPLGIAGVNNLTSAEVVKSPKGKRKAPRDFFEANFVPGSKWSKHRKK